MAWDEILQMPHACLLQKSRGVVSLCGRETRSRKGGGNMGVK